MKVEAVWVARRAVRRGSDAKFPRPSGPESETRTPEKICLFFLKHTCHHHSDDSACPIAEGGGCSTSESDGVQDHDQQGRWCWVPGKATKVWKGARFPSPWPRSLGASLVISGWGQSGSRSWSAAFRWISRHPRRVLVFKLPPEPLGVSVTVAGGETADAPGQVAAGVAREGDP